jgi:hypothetical protein
VELDELIRPSTKGSESNVRPRPLPSKKGSGGTESVLCASTRLG